MIRRILHKVPTFNTRIGGLGSVDTTASALATRLGISVGRISNFSITANEITCLIGGGSYTTPLNCFQSQPITSFFDYDGLCTNFGNSTFKTTSGGRMTEVYAPGIVTNTGTGIFQDNNNPIVLNMPYMTSVQSTFWGNLTGNTGGTIRFDRCTTYGATKGNDGVLAGNELLRSTIYAPISEQTSNGGGVEGDLAAVIADPTGDVIWV